MEKAFDVLVIDDDPIHRRALSLELETLGCRVVQAGSSSEALAAVRSDAFAAVFLDLGLGSAGGLELLPVLLGQGSRPAVVVTATQPSVETAVETLRQGAKDFLPKPISPVQIEGVIARLKGGKKRRGKAPETETPSEEALLDVSLETRSARMRAALDAARRAAVSDASVLLRGENGTGKTVLARMIHQMSTRRDGPFVVVNCPSLPEDLLMSELFGHVQGAFTGALHNRSGRVEMAESGTLFLDEIGEIQPKLQSKLLRFLQEKVFERVGDSRSLRADVRVLAATSRNLEAGVREGRFREDLLFRLNVVEIVLPPLRERGEDILPLAQGFLALFARLARRPALVLSPAAERLLRGYAWPGNVRELRNAIERAGILWPGPVLEPAAFPDRMGAQSGDGPRLGGWHTLEEIEREHIERVIEQIPNLEDAARILGIDDSTLWRKRKKFGKSESDRAKESP